MKFRPPRILVLTTCAIFLAIAITGFLMNGSKLPAAIQIDTEGQPTIGYPKARVRVVVFEEPKCSNCRDYNNQIFPTIKKEFIDTNKIQYTVIPVSFLPGSMPAAVAAQCVYLADDGYPNSDLFFEYLDYIYSHHPDEHLDWAKPDKLIEFAKATSPAINLPRLRNCIEMEKYRIKIQQNTEYGKKIMGVLSTPTVYVDGIEAKEITLDGLRKLIRQVLAHKGVN